ncbi:MAG: serine/threonine-protein kinase, partial [Kofleriaceae bacterium]
MVIDDATLARLRQALGADSFADRYELGEETGRGGMGVVYRAVERDGGRPLAIKVLSADVHDHARFNQEVAILERLLHPAIVGYVHHGVTPNGRAYLAMDWLDGESLAPRLRAGPLSIEAVVAIGVRVAEALAHAHAQGILHRDLKPSNVMLVGGDPKRATLIDFGIAKDVQATTLTSTGQLVGTPAYMAPEQASGREVDARADLFALGCLLHESLTGQPPFAGGDLLEVLAQVLMHEPPPVDQVRGDVPRRLEAVVTALLEKDPEHRVGTADAVVVELTAIASALDAGDRAALDRPAPEFRGHARTGAATSDERAPRARARRRRWLASIAGAVAAAVAITILVVHWTTSRAPVPTVAWSGASTAVAAFHFGAPPRHAPGPLVAPSFADEPTAGLGSRIVASTPCPARGAIAVAFEDGRIATIDHDGAAHWLGSVATGSPDGAIVCLGSGVILGVLGNLAFTSDKDAFATIERDVPAKIMDGVALGTTARWAGAGAIWEWAGHAGFTRVRASCPLPLRIAPDGQRVACRVGEASVSQAKIVVDDGTHTIEGPPRGTPVWSTDGATLYVGSVYGVFAWKVGAAAPELLTSGAASIVVTPRWLVVKRKTTLEWISVGDGPREHGQLELSAASKRGSILGPMPPDDALAVVYPDRGAAIAAVGEPFAEPRADSNVGALRAIAFAEDGLVMLARDGRVIVESLADRHRRVIGQASSTAYARLGVTADAKIVVASLDAVDVFDHEHATTASPGRTLLLEPGTSTVLRAQAKDHELVVAQLDPPTRLFQLPLAEGWAGIAIGRARKYALVQTLGADEVVDIATSRVVVRIDHGTHSVRSELLADEPVAIALVDSKQVYVVEHDHATPIVEFPNRISSLATAP